MPAHVLLIDDSPSDAKMFELVARNSIAIEDITHYDDGAQALEYLRTTPELIDVVVLDLNMPGMSGREVLHEIRSDSAFDILPVIITSAQSSLAEEESVSGTLSGAEFIDKSDGLDGCRAVVAAIEKLSSN